MWIKRNCNNCWKEYFADKRNLKRGWWLCCSKSCASQLREKNKPWYNPIRVYENNIKRQNWNRETIKEMSIADLDDWIDYLCECWDKWEF